MSHRSLGGRIRVYAVGIALLGSMVGLAMAARGEASAPSAGATAVAQKSAVQVITP